MVRFSFGISLLASLSSAHFTLQYPPTVGFVDSVETTAPCGGFTVDFSKDNVTNFNVGGSEIAVTSIHPQANWLFRGMLGADQNANNWTQLMPIVQQTGLGVFCEPAISVPASWAGQQGIIGIVQDAPDGILYQCAAVNFVSGVGTPNSACTNVSGLSASFVNDPVLTSTLNGTNTTGEGTASTTTASSTSSSTSKSAAMSTKPAGEGAMSILIFVGIASVTLVAGLS